MRKHPRQYSVIFTFYSLARSNLVIKRGKQASLRERESATWGDSPTLSTFYLFLSFFELQFVAVKKCKQTKHYIRVTFYQSSNVKVESKRSFIAVTQIAGQINILLGLFRSFSLSRDRELAIIKKLTLRIKRSKKDLTRLRVVPIFPQG